MPQGTRHRDLPHPTWILPVTTAALVAFHVVWYVRGDSTPGPAVTVSSAPADGAARPDCAAERTALAALDQAHPFDAAAPVSLATPPSRLTSAVDWQRALNMMRLRCVELLRADTLAELPQRMAGLDQLIVAWEANKSVEEINQLIDVARGRREWWAGLEMVQRASTRLQEAAQSKDYASCGAACEEIAAAVAPLREREGFDELFGEYVRMADDRREWANVMARAQGEYDGLPVSMTARETALNQFVEKYAAGQPDGMDLRKSGKDDGVALWSKAELELAMLSIDLDFGPAPGANAPADQPVHGRMTAEPLSIRLEAANKLRRRFPRAEVAQRLRSLVAKWLRATLAQRPQPLPNLDPKLQEAVSVESNVVAMGIYEPTPGRENSWNYWRSAAERIAKPNAPDRIVTTSRGDSDAKTIAAEPTVPYIVAATNRYNESLGTLLRKGGTLKEENWQAHIQCCEELVRSSAEMRSRVRNHGLFGGNTREEQANLMNAYLMFDFRQELRLAQDIWSSFPHLVELGQRVEEPTP